MQRFTASFYDLPDTLLCDRSSTHRTIDSFLVRIHHMIPLVDWVFSWEDLAQVDVYQGLGNFYNNTCTFAENKGKFTVKISKTQTNKQTYRQTDEQTNEQTSKQTDGRTRLRRITVSEVCIILCIMRKPNEIIGLLFIQNINSQQTQNIENEN